MFTTLAADPLLRARCSWLATVLAAVVALGCSSSGATMAPSDVATDLLAAPDAVTALDAPFVSDIVPVDAAPDALVTSDAAVDAAVDAAAPQDTAMDVFVTSDVQADAAVDGPIPVDATDAAPEVLPPRLLAPLSGGRTSTRRPTLRWVPPMGVSSFLVDLCADRACTRSLARLTVTGASARPTGPLRRGVVFWRVTGLDATGASVWTSATWEFEVPARDAPIDTSYGLIKDFNGDGFDDVIVGTDEHGHAYVYPGSSAGLPAPPSVDLTPVGMSGPSSFGLRLGRAGDLNGDGYGDIVISAFGDYDGQGSAYLVSGSPTGVSESTMMELRAPHPTDFGFSDSMDGAGDVNGDGYGDIVVGASCSFLLDSRCGAGVAYLYLGSASGISHTPASQFSAPVREEVGWSVAGVGDVDADGYADVLVGAPLQADGYGCAYLYYGGPTGLDASRSVLIQDPHLADQGTMVASAGDVNGDHYSDFLIGRPGIVDVYLGGPRHATWMPQATLENLGVVSDNPGDDLGAYPWAPGDLNGDGYSEVALGTACEITLDMPRCSRGRVYIYQGSASGIVATPVTSLTSTDARYYGTMVVSPGDVNGDGFDDLLVGAPGTSDSTTWAFAYAYWGSATGVLAVPHPLDGRGYLGIGYQVASVRSVRPRALRVEASGGRRGRRWPG